MGDSIASLHVSQGVIMRRRNIWNIFYKNVNLYNIIYQMLCMHNCRFTLLYIWSCDEIYHKNDRFLNGGFGVVINWCMVFIFKLTNIPLSETKVNFASLHFPPLEERSPVNRGDSAILHNLYTFAHYMTWTFHILAHKNHLSPLKII